MLLVNQDEVRIDCKDKFEGITVVIRSHKEVRIDCKDKFEGITVVIRSHKEVRIDCKDKFEGITVVVSFNSSTTAVICGAGTVIHSGAPKFFPGF
jgi:predicted RNA-binding protein YlqC (UPF0109 family)